jgi:hypothetical protein
MNQAARKSVANIITDADCGFADEGELLDELRSLQAALLSCLEPVLSNREPGVANADTLQVAAAMLRLYDRLLSVGQQLYTERKRTTAAALMDLLRADSLSNRESESLIASVAASDSFTALWHKALQDNFVHAFHFHDVAEAVVGEWALEVQLLEPNRLSFSVASANATGGASLHSDIAAIAEQVLRMCVWCHVYRARLRIGVASAPGGKTFTPASPAAALRSWLLPSRHAYDADVHILLGRGPAAEPASDAQAATHPALVYPLSPVLLLEATASIEDSVSYDQTDGDLLRLNRRYKVPIVAIPAEGDDRAVQAAVLLTMQRLPGTYVNTPSKPEPEESAAALSTLQHASPMLAVSRNDAEARPSGGVLIKQSSRRTVVPQASVQAQAPEYHQVHFAASPSSVAASTQYAPEERRHMAVEQRPSATTESAAEPDVSGIVRGSRTTSLPVDASTSHSRSPPVERAGQRGSLFPPARSASHSARQSQPVSSLLGLSSTPSGLASSSSLAAAETPNSTSIQSRLPSLSQRLPSTHRLVSASDVEPLSTLSKMTPPPTSENRNRFTLHKPNPITEDQTSYMPSTSAVPAETSVFGVQPRQSRVSKALSGRFDAFAHALSGGKAVA